MFEPVDGLAVQLLLDGNVRHRRGRRCAMPVPFAGREPHNVARANLFDRVTIALHASATGGDDQRLPEGMRVPGGPGTGFKCHGGAACACWGRALERRVNPHGTRKPVR